MSDTLKLADILEDQVSPGSAFFADVVAELRRAGGVEMIGRDEIFRMAREAGWPEILLDLITEVDMGRFTRFAALVAAAAKPQPLPKDQLWKAVDEGERAFVAGGPGTSWTLCVARAIEAAHGIRGEE